MISDRGGPRRAPNISLIILVVASFVLMTFDIRSQGEGVAATLRSGAQSIAAPLQDLARTVVDPVVDIIDGAANLAGLRAENERLRAENEELRAAQEEIEKIRQDNLLLQQFLDLTDRSEFPSVVAEVRGGTGTFDTGFVINKGTEQGIVAGNPVLNQANLLVGIIKDVFPQSATVIPVIGPTTGVEILTEGGDIGVVTGLGDPDRLELLILEASGPIEQGEILRTSATQRGIPGGLQVARVEQRLIPDGTLIESQEVTPVAELTGLRFVVVLQVSADDPSVLTTDPTSTTTLPTTTTVGGG